MAQNATSRADVYPTCRESTNKEHQYFFIVVMVFKLVDF
jgi:hypothetical protein